MDTVYGVDLVCRNPNSQGVDPNVRTLVGPNKGRSPMTTRSPWDTMDHELCDSLKESTNM